MQNFKKWYLEELKASGDSLSVTNLTVKERGRPAILSDLDDKLIHVLGAILRKGGALNCHVLRATARALLKANPAQATRVYTFDMPRSWVVSIYQRMRFVLRAGTTSRPPLPKGVYQESRLDI